jgi:hypothetical protein
MEDKSMIGAKREAAKEESQGVVESIMFTISEIKFQEKTKKNSKEKVVPYSSMDIFSTGRFKVFLVTQWNFESLQEEEPLLFFSDLEYFFSCQCRVKHKIASDLSLEVSSSRKISRFTIKDKKNMHKLFNTKITPIRNFTPSQNYKPESMRNMMRPRTRESRKYAYSRDLDSLASIEEKLQPLNLDSTSNRNIGKKFLHSNSGNKKLIQGSEISQKLYMSSRKILNDVGSMNMFRTRSQYNCECKGRATEEEFDRFWGEAMKDDKMGTLIGLLINAKVKVFRLDSKVFDA